MASKPTTVLVVDDSALYRQMIRNVLRELPEVEVVGLAKNGVEALSRIDELDPDLLTLDVQMPEMDGIQVLREMNRRKSRSKAIMVSSHTREGAQVTTDALLEGAFDFILKPDSSDHDINRQSLHCALKDRIAAFAQSAARPTRPTALFAPQQEDLLTTACDAVCLGISTGGPAALKIVLPRLPDDLAVPVFIVQHMPPEYTHSLARRLNETCPLEVCEAEDGMVVAPGMAVIAPGGRQIKIETTGGTTTVRVVDDPQETTYTPSVNHMIRSAIAAFDAKILAVIMTGMGRDGADACAEVKQRGGCVFAQHEESCVVYGMPKAVIEMDLADRILPLGRIAPAIVRHVKRSRR